MPQKKPIRMRLAATQFDVNTVTREELLGLVLYWKSQRDDAYDVRRTEAGYISYILGLIFQIMQLRNMPSFSDAELSRKYVPDYAY